MYSLYFMGADNYPGYLPLTAKNMHGAKLKAFKYFGGSQANMLTLYSLDISTGNETLKLIAWRDRLGARKDFKGKDRPPRWCRYWKNTDLGDILEFAGEAIK